MTSDSLHANGVGVDDVRPLAQFAGSNAARGTEVLRLRGVSKTYSGVRALDRVDFSCRVGEIHALVGENGSGKSTLIKVASGVVRAESGTISIGDVELSRPSPLASRRLGLLTAYQDTSLVLELSVADNLLMSFPGVHPLPAVPSRRHLHEMLEQYELSFPPTALVSELSPASRQILEVVRVLIHRPRVVLLDEPTAALDASSIATLSAILVRAREDGMGIVYISHRLDEVERLADRITVLRDGAIQGCYEGGSWNVIEIVNLMVGVPIDLEFPVLPDVGVHAPTAIELSRFSGSGFGPVDLSVRAGEIVGIAAAEGNGQRELVRSIVGLQRTRGTTTLAGEKISITSPRVARDAGLQFLSGDRAVEAAFGAMSVMQNATLPAADDLGPFHLVMRDRERRRFGPVARRLRIAHASPDQPLSELSGGNQQKTIMARSILRPGSVLVLDDPTAGVDARARLDIYRAVNERARTGAAVLICSSDSSELAGLCHRVYALSRGQVVDELTSELSEEEIVRAFVQPREDRGSRSDSSETSSHYRDTRPAKGLGPSWIPIGFVAILIAIVGWYANSKSTVFLSESNLYNLLLLVLPIGFVVLGEVFVLISGGVDASVGAMISVSIVLASFWATTDSVAAAVLSSLLIIGVGCAVGAVNWLIVRKLRINPLIATIAVLGILQGIALQLRPVQAGFIGDGLKQLLGQRIGFVPVAFIVLVALAGVADLWMMKTSSGLFFRASGRAEEMARRNGIRAEGFKFAGYVVCAAMAAIGGLFYAVQVGVGDATAGPELLLPAIAAAFIGGAGLGGGRGSFVGAILGALFMALLVNVTPLVNIDSAWTKVITGLLTIAAIIAYSVNSSTWFRRSQPFQSTTGEVQP